MKKLIIILIAAVSFNAASAQSWNTNNRKQVFQPKNQNAYAYNDNGHKNDRNRQAEYDRINKQYDQRINVYRNDRSLSAFERGRRIHEAEMERQKSLKSFGSGAIVGGVAGFLLGVLVTH